MSFIEFDTKNIDASGAGHHRINTDTSISCPFCFHGIETQPICGLKIDSENIQFFLKCKQCKNSFIGYSKKRQGPGYDEYILTHFSKGNNKVREFNKIINDLSSSFIKIYGEAEIAEFDKLSEISGIGYRKALEFLIKDYAISLNKEPEHEKIKIMNLGDCINKYIDNKKIKDISKRAVWIGNDETHYIRKWEDKDINDLKILINIVVHYIETEIESDKYIEEMNP